MILPTRRTFVTAAAAAAAAVSAAAAPAAAAAAKRPAVSAAATALAESARRYAPWLTAKDVESIAQQIDYNLRIGAEVNPKGEALKNWDEPATVFAVDLQ